MPKIPLAVRPEIQKAGEGAVPLRGGPGLNFGIDRGKDKLIDSLRGSIGAVGNMAAASLEFKRQSDESKNTLMAAQTRTLYDTINAELEDFMTSNPGAYDQYEQKAREADKRYEEESRQFTGQMTQQFRAEFMEGMAALRQRSIGFRIKVANQAKASALLEGFKTEFDNAAMRGDRETAEMMLDRETGRLIGKEQADVLRDRFDMIYDGKAARDLADSGAPDAIERLKAKNEDGSYKEFPKMEQNYRDSVIRYTEHLRSRYEDEQMDLFVADVQAGKTISEDSVLKRTDIRQGTKNDFIKILRSVQNAKVKQQTAEQKQARQYARDALEFEIMEHSFSPDPVERDKQFAAFNRRICTEFAADDPAYATQLKTQLNESLKAAMKPDTSYKNSAAYQYGENLIGQLAAQGKFFAQKPGTLWGTNETTGKADKPIMQYTEKLVRRDLDNYLRNHPNATEKEVRDVITTMTEDYNKTLVDELAERSIVHSRANTKIIPKEGQTGNYNGKKVIFKNGKWNYAE